MREVWTADWSDCNFINIAIWLGTNRRASCFRKNKSYAFYNKFRNVDLFLIRLMINNEVRRKHLFIDLGNVAPMPS